MIKIKIIPKFNSYRIVVANDLSKRDGRVIKQIGGGFADFDRDWFLAFKERLLDINYVIIPLLNSINI
ncbi:hypothetical protein ACA081_00840 [Candidatus Hodgkinia cicadicola]